MTTAIRPTASTQKSARKTPNRLQQHFFKWVDRRVPIAKSIKLHIKNLYTFPTIMGFAFMGLSLLLWVLGTNYQNNLILALSYLLFSLIVVAIHHTYANLSGLTITVVGAKPAFVGETLHFVLEVDGARASGNTNLVIRWWQGEDASFNFEPGSPAQILVGLEASQRGYLTPGKLLVESTFPLGLIRCWTWLNLDARAVVFPRPIKAPMPPPSQGEEDGELGQISLGGDDFAGLKIYRAGDPLKHIAWKHYAREQGLYSKEYANSAQTETWLEWESFLQLAPEDRLSALCYWALEFGRLCIPYGLRLPGKQIPPELGDGHRLSVLSALARFDVSLG